MHVLCAVPLRGVIGSRWEFGTPPRPVVLPYATDLVTRPDHRNRGLIASIMKAPFKDLGARDYQYVINLSASPMTLAVSLRLGWRSAGDVGLAVRRGWGWSRERQAHRILRGLPGLWRFADRLAPLVSGVRGRPFRVLDSKAWIRRREQPSLVTVAQAPRPNAMADLVRRLGYDGRLRHVRDVGYFSWRLQNPLATYRFLFHGGEQFDGYLVLEASTWDLGDRTSSRSWTGRVSIATSRPGYWTPPSRGASSRRSTRGRTPYPPRSANACRTPASFRLTTPPGVGGADPRCW